MTPFVLTPNNVAYAAVGGSIRWEEYRDEKAVQKAVWQLLGLAGCKRLWLSQMRKTGQTKGLPDLLAFHRVRGQVWIECKHPTNTQAKQSPEQAEFQEWCAITGQTYLLVRHPQPVADWLGGKT